VPVTSLSLHFTLDSRNGVMITFISRYYSSTFFTQWRYYCIFSV